MACSWMGTTPEMSSQHFLTALSVMTLLVVGGGGRATPTTGLYFMLGNRTLLPGQSINITDIGGQPIDRSDPGSTLVCITENVNTNCCRKIDTGGYSSIGGWYLDNQPVLSLNAVWWLTTNAFVRVVNYRQVRLAAVGHPTGPVGNYTCSVPDANGTIINATVSLVNVLAAPASLPSNVSAMSTSPTTIKVMWNEVPAIDQNGIIAIYEVIYTPWNTFGGQIFTHATNVSGSDLNVTLYYLEEYVNYNISVRAYTSEGPGPVITVNEVTQQSAPGGPPGNISAISTSPTSINVMWDEVPAIDQNGIIVIYQVIYTPWNTFEGQIITDATYVSGSDLNVTLHYLQEYVNYNISVRAYTSVGPGPSIKVTEVTQQTVPASPPGNISAMSTSPTAIEVMWDEVPAIDQNGIIAIYEVIYTPWNTFGGQIFTNITNVSGSHLNVTLHYLQEYVNYNISVRAYTSEGPGPVITVTEVTQQTAPAGPPGNISAISTSPTTIKVMWDEVPAIDQNGIIAIYEVIYTPWNTFGGQIFTNTTNVSGSDLNVTLHYLEEYVKYNISVRAYTNVGPGPVITVTEVTQQTGPDGSPRNVSAVVASSTNISVEWETVNEIQQNGIIIAYEITYTPQQTFQGAIGEMKTNVSGKVFSVFIGGLEEFVHYNVSVLAFTAIGGGPSSTNVMVLTSQSAPSKPPGNVSVVANSSTIIDVSWEEIPPIHQNGIITMYRVYYYPLETFNESIGHCLTNVSASQFTVRLLGLEEFVNYSVAVQAYAEVGSSNFSEEIVQSTLEDAPGEFPMILNATVISQRSIFIQWGTLPPIQQNGIIINYTVLLAPYVTANQPTVTLNTFNLELEVKYLIPFTRYNISVAAITQVGSGPRSPSIERETPSDGSPEIQSLSYNTASGVLTCISAGGPAIHVTWNRNGQVYNQNKIIADGIYHNLLTITSSQISHYTGSFTCTVRNTGGNSSRTTGVYKAIGLYGEQAIYSFGSTASVICFSNLTIVNIIWVGMSSDVPFTAEYLGQNKVRLTIDVPINRDLHGSTFSCKALIKLPTGNIATNEMFTIRTEEQLSGPVASFLVEAQGDAEIHITWRPPDMPGGMITGYSLRIRDLKDNNFIEDIQISLTTFMRQNLEEGIPYNVSVAAVNDKGYGEITSTLVFTKELKSDVAPEFTVQRITATIMTVSWSMLTVVEARGFVRNYTIFYFTVSSERQLLNAMSDTVDGNTNKIYIDGLNESLVYSVQMSANTGAGTGARSREITVPLYVESELSQINTGVIIGAAVMSVSAVVIVLTTVICVSLLLVVQRKITKRNSTMKQDKSNDQCHDYQLEKDKIKSNPSRRQTAEDVDMSSCAAYGEIPVVDSRDAGISMAVYETVH